MRQTRRLVALLCAMAAVGATSASPALAGGGGQCCQQCCSQQTNDPDHNGDVHSNCHTGSKGRGAGGEDKTGSG